MLRKIVLDAETTGLDAKGGDRIVEVGCLEIYNFVPTGRTFQTYINPEREVHPDATAVTGLTYDFLKDFPLFAQIAGDLFDFIGSAPLVIHNARFDMEFLNAERTRLGMEPLPQDQSIDTLDLARRLFPGSAVSLDALCRRFGVDNSRRTQHGALLDCELLAEVYLHLMGGKQTGLDLSVGEKPVEEVCITQRKSYPVRIFEPTAEEIVAHALFCASMPNSLWKELQESLNS